jgi:hypothetical protein
MKQRYDHLCHQPQLWPSENGALRVPLLVFSIGHNHGNRVHELGYGATIKGLVVKI